MSTHPHQAEPHLLIPGPRDEATGEVLEFFRISETLDHARAPANLTAFCNLTDFLLDRIMTDPSAGALCVCFFLGGGFGWARVLPSAHVWR